MRKTDAMSEADNKVVFRCLDQVRKKQLPLLPGSSQLASALEQAAYDAALQDPAVLKAGKRWHECMRPQGVADLPPDPRGMPSPSVTKRFALDVITEESILQGPKVSAEEIALATADAECQESSGYAQKLYDALHNFNAGARTALNLVHPLPRQMVSFHPGGAAARRFRRGRPRHRRERVVPGAGYGKFAGGHHAVHAHGVERPACAATTDRRSECLRDVVGLRRAGELARHRRSGSVPRGLRSGRRSSTRC